MALFSFDSWTLGDYSANLWLIPPGKELFKSHQGRVLLVLRGFPPKVILIKRGNCSTAEIETILRSSLFDIQRLVSDSSLGILTLF